MQKKRLTIVRITGGKFRAFVQISVTSCRNDFLALLGADGRLNQKSDEQLGQTHPEARRIRSFTEVTVVRCVPIMIMDPTTDRTSSSVFPRKGSQDGMLTPPLIE